MNTTVQSLKESELTTPLVYSEIIRHDSLGLVLENQNLGWEVLNLEKPM